MTWAFFLSLRGAAFGRLSGGMRAWCVMGQAACGNLGWKLVVTMVLVGLAARVAAETGRVATNRWERELAAFEAADRARFPQPGGILFVGSSSVRVWEKLAEDFAGYPVIGRGVGGCLLTDVNGFADRLILPYRPRVVVVYAGENDLAGGGKAAEVVEAFRELCARVHQALPASRIIYIGIKPSPVRWYAVNEAEEANRQIAEFVKGDARLGFVDVFARMLEKDGTPRLELFGKDQLHLSREGYRLWTRLIEPQLGRP